MNSLSKALLSYQLFTVSSESLRGKVNHRGLNIFDTRIIGGEEAKGGRFSYAVSLQNDDGLWCGGSLIAKDVVLSAAHCAGGYDKVVIGRHDLRTSQGVEVAVALELPHPEYDPDTADNDFMLIFLERATTEDVDLVQLGWDHVPADKSVTVVGWGDIHKSDSIDELADVLMEVEVKTISNKECDQSSGTIGTSDWDYHDQITDNMVCARDPGQDSCQGDSGGPLVVKGYNGSADVQIGVVSWGFSCAHKEFPGVYARVSSKYAWIKAEVCRRSSSAPSYFECIVDDADYCTRSSDTDCYVSGWPQCCDNSDQPCPARRIPRCDNQSGSRWDFCASQPDTSCYKTGHPACCDRFSGTNCPSEQPRCDI